MAGKDMIVFGTDLNKILKEEAMVITPVPDAKPLTIVPSKELAIVPPTRSYEQAYYAQVCQPTLSSSPTKLLLKDALKDKKVVVPQGTKVLPPKDNERVINVKTNKFGDVTYVKYATTSRVSLD
jgi:hypothetical protein